MTENGKSAGGTPGARSLPEEIVTRIEEIAARHGMSWKAGEELYRPFITAGLMSPGNIKRLTLAQLRSSISRAVKAYREAPPPPPSRVSRDYIEPALKAAARLTASLDNEYARAVLANVFEGHGGANKFLEDVRRLAALEAAAPDTMQKVQRLLDEFDIVGLDPREHITSTFGPEALREFDATEAEARALDAKQRTDPIRFHLAHETVSAIVNGFGLWGSIGLEKGIKRQALAEIVTLMVEVVGTFDGAPRPSEDYFAKTITNEAVDAVIADYKRDAVGEKYGL
jgi:hypothetical protein